MCNNQNNIWPQKHPTGFLQWLSMTRTLEKLVQWDEATRGHPRSSNKRSYLGYECLYTFALNSRRNKSCKNSACMQVCFSICYGPAITWNKPTSSPRGCGGILSSLESWPYVRDILTFLRSTGCSSWLIRLRLLLFAGTAVSEYDIMFGNEGNLCFIRTSPESQMTLVYSIQDLVSSVLRFCWVATFRGKRQCLAKILVSCLLLCL